jgi:MerR family regulatory protein
MGQALSISALAKSTGVTSKTLRYWERVGLLPRANRTHTGYRIFAPEVLDCSATFFLRRGPCSELKAEYTVAVHTLPS